jgi:predicted HTH domain antitoxin
MQITVQLPDDIAEHQNSGREALEALALEGYRSRQLGNGQLRRMLGFSTPMQVHEFLKQHGIYLNYSMEDLEKDMASLNPVQKRSA